MTPYILPSMLKDLAPLGIDWDSIPDAAATPQENLAALLDICYIATDAIDSHCFQPLRSTADVEELNGPDQRLYVENSTGIAVAQMEHWPVTDVLGVQIAQSAQFPPQWQLLPSTAARPRQASAQFLGGSFLGSSGSDGMNMIEIQPGYIVWNGIPGVGGRNAYKAQIAYENGWPTAGLLPTATATGTTDGVSNVITDVTVPEGLVVGTPLAAVYDQTGDPIIQPGSLVTDFDVDANTITISLLTMYADTNVALSFGYPAGVTSLIVDDVTGMAGTGPTIFNGQYSETVRVLSGTADAPIEVLPTIFAQIGEGVLTLATPTRRPHVGSSPAQALVSAMPSNVRLAGYYYAGAQALQRGSTSFTVQALPDSTLPGGGTPSIGVFTKMAEDQLKNFPRIF